MLVSPCGLLSCLAGRGSEPSRGGGGGWSEDHSSEIKPEESEPPLGRSEYRTESEHTGSKRHAGFVEGEDLINYLLLFGEPSSHHSNRVIDFDTIIVYNINQYIFYHSKEMRKPLASSHLVLPACHHSYCGHKSIHINST